MESNGKHSNNVFSKRISGGGRTYFLDVYKSEKSGTNYLLISESRNIDGNWVKNRVAIFPDQLDEWREGLESCLNYVKGNSKR